MYKVMIVDDEMLARVGIKSLIRWEENGFTVVGEAENGKKAYDKLMVNPVDIVITDIKMPVMNGIELISNVRQHYPDIKFIVLSSFDDFDYVREALKNGAEDYFIKLQMEPDKLLDQLKKIAEKLDHEGIQKKQIAQHDRLRNKEIDLLREKLFKDLAYGWIHTEPEYLQRTKEAELELFEGLKLSLVFQTDGMEIYEKYGNDEIHLLNYAILNILHEISSGHNQCYSVSMHPKEFLMLYFAPPHQGIEETLRQACQLAETIKYALKKYLNFSVCIAISEPVHHFMNIKQSYRQAMETLSLRYAHSEGTTFLYREINSLSATSEATDIAKEIRNLELYLQRHEDNHVIKVMDNLRYLLANMNGYSLESLKVYCAPIVFLLSSRWGEEASAWMDNHLKGMDHWSSKSDMIKWLEKVQETWVKGMGTLSDGSRLIQSAMRFIQRNYSNSVTLESVAEYLQLSPSYLSNLFKKETGRNFIDYVTHLRIEQSKILLRTTELKIYEVGHKVGYENEHYFSRVFKKIVGCSPVQYKTDTTL
ncbi:two-component system response regulator YesN [Paenibacillus shirakamiensis]|uniref:Two-component system response regulator YesN n=1 Tax=Paenibacillus shirakamiensis TaxID=1265935 RepID=A0ABS4JEE6_9BACL|nr:response regulator [Paenibacillus shirakamiensis]MBP2000076.1 two-component system response regulator YesN [Paenibacillus shirakamiensis]